MMFSWANEHPWEIAEIQSHFGVEKPAPSAKVQDFLFEVLHEFGPEEQRLFLRFLTGCARLPVGGTLEVLFQFIQYFQDSRILIQGA